MKTRISLVITASLASVLAGASARAQSRETTPTPSPNRRLLALAATAQQQGLPAQKIMVTGHGDNVVITLRGSRPQAWSYNMATGQLTPTSPEPQQNVSPTLGIGVVVKRNPGSSPARTIPASGGSADLSSLAEGGYDITITCQGIKTARDVTSHTPDEFQSRSASGAADPNARVSRLKAEQSVLQNERLRPQTVTVTMHANVSAKGITIDGGPRARAEHETPVLKRDSVR